MTVHEAERGGVIDYQREILRYEFLNSKADSNIIIYKIGH